MTEELCGYLKRKYRYTAWVYDLLDYPWEREYRLWRPKLLSSLSGTVLEAGVGTGRNLPYYPSGIELQAFDLSPQMLHLASRRAKQASCSVVLNQANATDLHLYKNNQFDWLVSTFLCCVLPAEAQPYAIKEFMRVLKPGGQFKLLEMVYSLDVRKRALQERVSRLVEYIYGARFDRPTLSILQAHPRVSFLKTSFLKDDTYLLIEGTVE